MVTTLYTMCTDDDGMLHSIHLQTGWQEWRSHHCPLFTYTMYLPYAPFGTGIALVLDTAHSHPTDVHIIPFHDITPIYLHCQVAQFSSNGSILHPHLLNPIYPTQVPNLTMWIRSHQIHSPTPYHSNYIYRKSGIHNILLELWSHPFAPQSP